MSDDDDAGNDSGINITLGKLIAYPIGILLLLSGVGGLISNPVGGLLILLAGVLALPIARSKLKDQTGVGINRWAASVIVLVLMISGAALLPQGSGGNDLATGDSGGGDGLIEQPAGELTPTVDDFESGWRVVENENGTADFVSSAVFNRLRGSESPVLRPS